MDERDEIVEPIDSEHATSDPADIPDSGVETDSEELNPTEEDYLSGERDAKAPLFHIEPRKEGCTRDDHLLLISKKVGFVGLVTFLMLSIVMGAMMRIWANSLNLLFMSLAVLSYGIENILHLVAIKGCQCRDCAPSRTRLKTITIACIAGFLVLLAIYLVRQFTA